MSMTTVTLNNEQIKALGYAPKPVFVARSLSDLTGPAEGHLRLPLHLDWTPCNHYDLSLENDVRRLILTVLSEAGSQSDISRYLNGRLLLEYWDKVHIPPRIRVAWESAHPELNNADG